MNETFLKKFLNYYKLTYEDYLNLSKKAYITDLPNVENIDKIEHLRNLITNITKRNLKILIYGDYDCDGIMATTITYLTFKKLGMNESQIRFYIPKRTIDGYGLTIQKAVLAKNANYDYIITVDNGISANEAIEYAKEYGIKVIVIDHHELPKKLPNADFILHPSLSKISNVNISAGFLCLIFSRIALGYYDDYLVTLAMTSTISDMMELVGLNRSLVKYGMNVLNEKKYLQFRLLSGYQTSIAFNEEIIGINVCSKINSIGRMVEDSSNRYIVKYFLSNTSKNIIEISNWILKINEVKKQTLLNVDFEKFEKETENSGIFIISNVREGLIGLLCNKLLEKYKKPTIVIAKNENIQGYKGSIRSKDGFNVNDFLSENSNLLIEFGGHEKAGGFSLKEENIQDFKNRFFKYSKDHPFKENNDNYISLDFSEISFDTLNIIDSLRPYGVGFKKPKLVIENVLSKGFVLSKNEKHAFYRNNMSQNCITYFNFDPHIFDFQSLSYEGHLSINQFDNHARVEFIVENYFD